MCVWTLWVFTDDNLVTFQGKTTWYIPSKSLKCFAHSVCLQLKLSTRSQKKKNAASFVLSPCQQSRNESKQSPKLAALNIYSVNYSPALVPMERTSSRSSRRYSLMSATRRRKEDEMCVRSSESFWQQRQSSNEPLSPFLSSPPSTSLPLSPPPPDLSQSLPLKKKKSLLHSPDICAYSLTP